MSINVAPTESLHCWEVFSDAKAYNTQYINTAHQRTLSYTIQSIQYCSIVSTGNLKQCLIISIPSSLSKDHHGIYWMKNSQSYVLHRDGCRNFVAVERHDHGLRCHFACICLSRIGWNPMQWSPITNNKRKLSLEDKLNNNQLKIICLPYNAAFLLANALISTTNHPATNCLVDIFTTTVSMKYPIFPLYHHFFMLGWFTPHLLDGGNVCSLNGCVDLLCLISACCLIFYSFYNLVHAGWAIAW